MTAALALGRRGQGRVWPNPAVGCIVVNNGLVVGRARTADGGRPHAETEALAQAGAAAVGATAYVTLEPCAHQGETGPCANALVSAGVARVVVATTDPDPRVSGAGIEILRKSGILVDLGVCKDLADIDHAGFFSRVQTSKPFVTLKLASTLDGRIATKSGDSQWITGPQSRQLVHVMRSCHDAVMVGAGTARVDNPSLNVRGMGDVPQPVRVVISRDLNIPRDGHLAMTAKQQPLWMLHGGKTPVDPWEQIGARCFDCGTKGRAVDLRSGLQQLANAGLTRVFCEGGGSLAAGLIAEDLVDALVVFSAGVAIGGDGTPSLGSLGVEALSDAPRFGLAKQQSVGGDVVSYWSRS